MFGSLKTWAWIRIRITPKARIQSTGSSKNSISYEGSSTGTWAWENQRGSPAPCTAWQARAGSTSRHPAMINRSSQSINQSANQSTSQSIKQPIRQQSVNQPVSQSINQSVNQSTSQSINQPVSQSINQSANQSTSQPINQPVGQSINQPINQSANHFSQSIN